jgi:serine protease Do
MRRILLAAALAVCLALAASAAWAQVVADRPGSFAGLAREAGPAVVNIYIVKQGRAVGPEFFLPFETKPQRGQGSGFIVDRDGYVVTNNHVVQRADQIRVRLADKREFDAKVIGADQKTDLALLKIEASNLPSLKFGDSDALQVGDWVLAIGNPLGLSHTVTAGIVSAKGRTLGIGPYEQYIQTDASINPGNSGGPLINTAGEVVGVNTLIAAPSQGIGFAIPSNLVQTIVAQLKKSGTVIRAWLGISYQNVTPELADGFGLDRPRGALINQVMDDSPAQRAGVQAGDVVVEFNGHAIEDAGELPILVASTAPGQEVALKLIRAKKPTTITVKLIEQPETVARAGVPPKEEGPGRKREPSQVFVLGMELVDVTPEIARGLGVEPGRGVMIKSVRPLSPAAMAGLSRGDIIISMNNQRASRAADLSARIEQLPTGSRVLLFVQRGDNTFWVALPR